MTLLARTLADLALVAEYWPAVAELRDPSTHAPRPPSTLTAAARAELDYEARIERQERADIAPGEHPDAVRVEILDLMAQTVADAVEAAYEVALALGLEAPEPPSSAFGSPEPQLAFLRGRVDALDPTALRRVAAVAGRMAAEVTRALYLAPDGQVLQARCPWCRGGLTGDYTLRVRLLPGDLAAVVCESDVPCGPPRRKVGTWFLGRPAWPVEQWGWLAKELHRVDERVSA